MHANLPRLFCGGALAIRPLPSRRQHQAALELRRGLRTLPSGGNAQPDPLSHALRLAGPGRAAGADRPRPAQQRSASPGSPIQWSRVGSAAGTPRGRASPARPGAARRTSTPTLRSPSPVGTPRSPKLASAPYGTLMGTGTRARPRTPSPPASVRVSLMDVVDQHRGDPGPGEGPGPGPGGVQWGQMVDGVPAQQYLDGIKDLYDKLKSTYLALQRNPRDFIADDTDERPPPAPDAAPPAAGHSTPRAPLRALGIPPAGAGARPSETGAQSKVQQLERELQAMLSQAEGELLGVSPHKLGAGDSAGLPSGALHPGGPTLDALDGAGRPAGGARGGGSERSAVHSPAEIPIIPRAAREEEQQGGHGAAQVHDARLPADPSRRVYPVQAPRAQPPPPPPQPTAPPSSQPPSHMPSGPPSQTPSQLLSQKPSQPPPQPPSQALSQKPSQAQAQGQSQSAPQPTVSTASASRQPPAQRSSPAARIRAMDIPPAPGAQPRVAPSATANDDDEDEDSSVSVSSSSSDDGPAPAPAQTPRSPMSIGERLERRRATNAQNAQKDAAALAASLRLHTGPRSPDDVPQTSWEKTLADKAAADRAAKAEAERAAAERAATERAAAERVAEERAAAERVAEERAAAERAAAERAAAERAAVERAAAERAAVERAAAEKAAVERAAAERAAAERAAAERATAERAAAERAAAERAAAERAAMERAAAEKAAAERAAAERAEQERAAAVIHRPGVGPQLDASIMDSIPSLVVSGPTSPREREDLESAGGTSTSASASASTSGAASATQSKTDSVLEKIRARKAQRAGKAAA